MSELRANYAKEIPPTLSREQAGLTLNIICMIGRISPNAAKIANNDEIVCHVSCFILKKR